MILFQVRSETDWLKLLMIELVFGRGLINITAALYFLMGYSIALEHGNTLLCASVINHFLPRNNTSNNVTNGSKSQMKNHCSRILLKAKILSGV